MHSFLQTTLNWLANKSKTITLPGFDGISLYDVSILFGKGIFEGKVGLRASAVAYNFFLAIFPTILFFFTLIPYIPIHDFQLNLLELMQEVIPDKTYAAVHTTLTDILTIHHTGLLSVGFVMALYFSTNGIHALIDSFNDTAHVIESRSWIKQRLVAIILVFILSFLVVLGIALLTSGTDVLKYLVNEGFIKGSYTFELIQVGKWIVIILIFLFSVSFLYYFAPAQRGPFRFISAGSNFATILTILSTFGFNYYVNKFSSYNALYGSIGTLIIFMMWLYANAWILLLGYELNASIYAANKDKKDNE